MLTNSLCIAFVDYHYCFRDAITGKNHFLHLSTMMGETRKRTDKTPKRKGKTMRDHVKALHEARKAFK